MAQKAETFFHSIREAGAPIDTLINRYLEKNPSLKIAAISYAIGGTFEKALVIFNDETENNEVPNDETECKKNSQEKNDGRRQNSQKGTYISKSNGGGSADDYKPVFGETKRKSDH